MNDVVLVQLPLKPHIEAMNATFNEQSDRAGRPRQFDELIPIVADVIQHSLTLQQRAEDAVGAVDAAADKCREASTQLQNAAAGLDKRLATQVVQAVSVPFEQAIDGAVHRIAGDMEKVKVQADRSIKDLKAATEVALNAVKEQSSALEERLIRYLVGGVFLGFVVGAATVWLLTSLKI